MFSSPPFLFLESSAEGDGGGWSFAHSAGCPSTSRTWPQRALSATTRDGCYENIYQAVGAGNARLLCSSCSRGGPEVSSGARHRRSHGHPHRRRWWLWPPHNSRSCRGPAGHTHLPRPGELRRGVRLHRRHQHNLRRGGRAGTALPAVSKRPAYYRGRRGCLRHGTARPRTPFFICNSTGVAAGSAFV